MGFVLVALGAFAIGCIAIARGLLRRSPSGKIAEIAVAGDRGVVDSGGGSKDAALHQDRRRSAPERDEIAEIRALVTKIMAGVPLPAAPPPRKSARQAVDRPSPLITSESAGSNDITGDCPLVHFSAAHMLRLRDLKAARPGAARNRVAAIRVLFAWGVERGHSVANPARDVRARRPKTAGFHTWSAEEIEQFEKRHPIGGRARLAMALLAFTGQRRGDVVTVGPQHLKGDWLTFVQRKGVKRNPESMSVPFLPELRAILDASPTGDLTFLTTSYGRPFSAAGFGNRFRLWCDEAPLPQCSAHGLRKAGATIAAERGATDAQLMAIFSWRKADMAAHYRRAANQKTLAESALRLLAREQK